MSHAYAGDIWVSTELAATDATHGIEETIRPAMRLAAVKSDVELPSTVGEGNKGAHGDERKKQKQPVPRES